VPATPPQDQHGPDAAICTLLRHGTNTSSSTYNGVEELVRKLILVLVCCLPLLAVSAFADDWSKTYTVGATPSLRVDTNDAAIEIARGSSNSIAARVISEGYKSGEVRVTEHQDGDKVDLTVRLPSEIGFHIGGHYRRARVEIQVPAETSLDLHSSDGHITVNGTTGPANIGTGDGAVEVHDFRGNVRARTSDGHINVDGVVTDVYLHSGDGHIELTARPGSKMDRGWLIHTSDGRVDVKLPDDFAAELSARTGDGRIELDFPVTVNGTIGRSRVRGKLNGGGQLLEITTGDGRIHIGKL
jgi:Toastrack DUF4097